MQTEREVRGLTEGGGCGNSGKNCCRSLNDGKNEITFGHQKGRHCGHQAGSTPPFRVYAMLQLVGGSCNVVDALQNEELRVETTGVKDELRIVQRDLAISQAADMKRKAEVCVLLVR
jgi:hypothetical protein